MEFPRPLPLLLPKRKNPASLRGPGSEKTLRFSSLAGFLTRPQAENQIGAA
jgi:hypothetical protein